MEDIRPYSIDSEEDEDTPEFETAPEDDELPFEIPRD
jgi:hypothetical protein